MLRSESCLTARSFRSVLRKLVWLLACLLPPAQAGEACVPQRKTLGGPVYWTDYIVHGDWRVQKHTGSEHYRLLDPSNRRIQSGSLTACYTELDRRRRQREIAPMPTHVVIVMHGLAGTRNLMRPLCNYLEEQGGYTVLNVGYASTQGSIQDQAYALESILRNLQGVEEVSFVCHSMSNIIVRHLLYRLQHCQHPLPLSFRRMVMISPPNQGAELADRPFWGALGRTTLGEVVQQLAPNQGWRQLQRELAVPAFEFGILAGGKGNSRGYLVSLPGDDDGILTLETHFLEGHQDYQQLGGLHQIMPRLAPTKAAVLRFLNCGSF